MNPIYVLIKDYPNNHHKLGTVIDKEVGWKNTLDWIRENPEKSKEFWMPIYYVEEYSFHYVPSPEMIKLGYHSKVTKKNKKVDKAIKKFLKEMKEAYKSGDTIYNIACAAMDLKKKLDEKEEKIS